MSSTKSTDSKSSDAKSIMSFASSTTSRDSLLPRYKQDAAADKKRAEQEEYRKLMKCMYLYPA